MILNIKGVIDFLEYFLNLLNKEIDDFMENVDVVISENLRKII